MLLGKGCLFLPGHQGRADDGRFPSKEVRWNSDTTQHHDAVLLPSQLDCLHLATRNSTAVVPGIPALKERSPVPSCLHTDKHYGVSMPHGHPQWCLIGTYPCVPVHGKGLILCHQEKTKSTKQFSTSISSLFALQNHSHPDLQ